MALSAWKRAGFKQNPNQNASMYWLTTPGDKYWKKAFSPSERAERLRWADACVKVQVSARRLGDAGLMEFAGAVGYGCFLFHLAGGGKR